MATVERLQKLIAQAGLASRRQAEQWLKDGRVRVNGRSVTLGDKADPSVDRIEVDGKALPRAEQKLYLLLNKPLGYVTTLKDPQGRPTIRRFLKGIPQRVYPVGRLDVNSEGLLLLTNDGALTQHLLHPRHQVSKTYRVKVNGRISPQACRQLEQGVELEDGVTAPAVVRNVHHSPRNSWFDLEIREGRNRQVRRMCRGVGFEVSALKRIRIGSLELGTLAKGQCRSLTSKEIQDLKSLFRHQ
ncbi:pseudouridine synthase [Desulfuromonas acetoxidans]|uniref:Pseudouridine synthase n=1 Tax=Desulfuromonas acetoxidans (strain DSM 684 / 11070) TaxID=281689 RepID=Q1JVP4_DESA6|nr:pseudouridine synthase [Desulfuromonas acetoxidans]EAT14305.1 Pseudouridine synthase, Rsu [Desulfuromonas acetoxidans DSM 684]MBF0645073.1 rRNA pseudouridine synthase [Desulfuromonas acetoxidans]NVD23118.1 rRNA pseudouridine synthase [Desulfuromonas acetoxidans]NVE15641.1 rRNA pseudouridine synthase [Desulfuromonas acetoxidans]